MVVWNGNSFKTMGHFFGIYGVGIHFFWSDDFLGAGEFRSFLILGREWKKNNYPLFHSLFRQDDTVDGRNPKQKTANYQPKSWWSQDFWTINSIFTPTYHPQSGAAGVECRPWRLLASPAWTCEGGFLEMVVVSMAFLYRKGWVERFGYMALFQNWGTPNHPF